jgi:GTPase
VFRHAHEQETGRTSAIGSQYLGFDEGGQPVLTKKLGRLLPWKDLAQTSKRTLQLIDLAGHEKYLKVNGRLRAIPSTHRIINLLPPPPRLPFLVSQE